MSKDRHPLDDALSDAEREGETYEVPVALVRTRVRRRRRARSAARSGVALSALVAVAVTLPAVLDRSDLSGPVTGDWPAAFDRCGQPADLPASDTGGPFTVEIVETGGVIGADRISHTMARVSIPRMTATAVSYAGTDVVLLRDGVVVGVATDGPVTVPLPEAPWPAPARGTVTTEWGFGAVLASCAQYPDGDGDPRVPAGDYELGVTYTFDWTAHDGRHRSTRASRTLPVRVTEDPYPTAEPDPTECLADAALLTALSGPEANPAPLVLDADVPAVVLDTEVRMTVRATNTGPSPVDGLVERPSVLLTIDGKVVRTPYFWREASTASPTLAPGETVEYDLVVPLTDCTSIGLADAPYEEQGVPVQPGRHDVWVVMEMDTPTAGAAATDGSPARQRVVGGPWPLTLG